VLLVKLLFLNLFIYLVYETQQLDPSTERGGFKTIRSLSFDRWSKKWRVTSLGNKPNPLDYLLINQISLSSQNCGMSAIVGSSQGLPS
jgi:hypothetical protein